MVRSFIKANRKISKLFGNFVNKLFGHIDDCEEVFDKEVSQHSFNKAEVLEIGGTQRPYFKKSEIKRYVGLDIDKSFDWKYFYHEYLNQSCTEHYTGNFDFIFSKYLLEHVADNSSTYFNMISALKPGGVAVHIFPLGYHPYTCITRMVGNKLQRALIRLVRPDTVGITGYPAFYDLCNSIALNSYFKRKSEVQVRIRYFYGADDYFAFFFPFYLLSILFNRTCKILRLNLFASNAVLVIKKNL